MYIYHICVCVYIYRNAKFSGSLFQSLSKLKSICTLWKVETVVFSIHIYIYGGYRMEVTCCNLQFLSWVPGGRNICLQFKMKKNDIKTWKISLVTYKDCKGHVSWWSMQFRTDSILNILISLWFYSNFVQFISMI